MATPVSITDITPSEGEPAGGSLIVITGAGFDADTQKMRVLFGGIESKRVRVIDGLSPNPLAPEFDLGTILDCFVPTFPLTEDSSSETGIVEPGKVDVKVINDATVSEDTSADGYEYKRPDQGEESHLSLVYRTLINTMKRDIIPEVSPVASMDWARKGAVERAVKELPAIILEGPDMVDPNEGAEDYERILTEDKSTFTWDHQRETLRDTLEFDVTIVTRGGDGGLVAAMSLMRACQKFFRVNPYLCVAEGKTGIAATIISEYPMRQHLQFQKIEPADDVFAYKAVASIEDVGIQMGEVIESGFQFQVDTKPTVRVVKKT